METVFRIVGGPHSRLGMKNYGSVAAAAIERLAIRSSPQTLPGAFVGLSGDALERAVAIRFADLLLSCPGDRFIVVIDEESGDCRYWKEAS